MDALFWSYIGIGLSVLALLLFPLWWMIASYKRRGKQKS